MLRLYICAECGDTSECLLRSVLHTLTAHRAWDIGIEQITPIDRKCLNCILRDTRRVVGVDHTIYGGGEHC